MNVLNNSVQSGVNVVETKVDKLLSNNMFRNVLFVLLALYSVFFINQLQ